MQDRLAETGKTPLVRYLKGYVRRFAIETTVWIGLLALVYALLGR